MKSGEVDRISWLVIGVGNTLRRDDGLGPWLAERIASWELPGIATRSVHQLTPELAVEIATHDAVLFLDACSLDSPQLLEVTPSSIGQPWGHALAPGNLLALAEGFTSRKRRAWLMAVPGFDFAFGESLSARAVEAAETALSSIAQLLALPQRRPPWNSLA